MNWQQISLARAAAIESMSDGVIVLDAQDRIVDLNPAAQRIIGRPASAVIGQPADQILADWLAPSAGSGPALSGTEGQTLVERYRAVTEVQEEVIVGEGQAQCYYDLRVSPLYDRHKRLTGRLIALHDITARRRAEEALRENERNYRNIIERASDGIVLIDEQGTIIKWNRGEEEISGLKRSEVLGRPLWDVQFQMASGGRGTQQAGYEHVKASILECLRTGQASWLNQAQEQEIRRPDGTRRIVQTSVSAIKTNKGFMLSSIMRDITERKQAEEALRHRAEELAALHETSLDITTPHDLPTLLHTIVERAARLLDVPSGSLFLCDPKRQEVHCVVSYNTRRDYTGTVLKYGEGTAGIVAQTGVPLIIDDYRTWSGRATVYEEEQPFTAVLSAPMIWQGQVTGVIHVLHDVETRRFAQADLDLLTRFANQAAIAVEDARLLEAERRRADELDALRETVADISAELELPRLLHAVLQRAVTLLGVTGGDLGLYNEEKQEVMIVQSYNMGKDYTGTRMALGEGAMGRVAQTCEPVIVDDYTTWEGRSPQYAEGPWHAVMATPLMSRGRLIGAIGIVDVDPVRQFTPSELHLLNLFAQQAAIAVQNARLFEAEQRRTQEAETLRQTGAVVAATLQQDEAIQRILEQLEHVVPYDSASVQLLREEYVEIVGGRGWSDPTMVIGLRFPVPVDNPNTVVIQERRPHILGDAPAAHAPFREDPHSHIRSWLGVPLIVGDRVIGMLTVDSTQPNHFTADHARLATAFANQVAIALENARLFEAERRRSEELEALRQAGLRLTSSLELQPVLEAILHHTLRLVEATNAHIFLYDGERLTFGAALWANGRQQTPYVEVRFDGLTYTVARSGERIVIPDANSHPLYRDWQWGGAIVGLPLRVGNQVRGVMNVAFDRPHAFDEEELRVLELLADQAAIALENARLFQAEQSRRNVAAALLEISHVAGSSLELKQILKQIARLTAEACQTDRCSVFLLDDAQEYLQPVMSQFADGHVEPEMWQRFKATTADRIDVVPLFRDAIRQHRPTRLDDPTRTDLIPRKWTEPFGIQKLLVVPLISHERVIGIMALDYTDADREFTPEQIELAQTIGGQVAVSIKNAQLYARMQQLAITDSLTGLYNRRGFFELGRREVERARRFGRPLTAIMFDLDHFKRVNDAYGHRIGDQVLAGLAELCRQVLRDVDLLGRYGGDEFTVLLPESGLTTARPVAERLRRRVERAAIDTDRGPMTITISLGVAMLDEKCAGLEALLERADQALYAAKQAGWNRVCVEKS